jgi:hypothetical protein
MSELEAISATERDSKRGFVIIEKENTVGSRVAERGKAVLVWDAFTFGASSHFDPATPYVPRFCQIIDIN